MQHNTINEACQIIRCKRTKCYQLLNSGFIKAIKLGNKTLIIHQSIIDYLAKLPAYPVKGGSSNDQ